MPKREFEKLRAINRFLNLEFIKEAELQEITRLAAQICQLPMAIVTLANEGNLQYIKYKFGKASIENRIDGYTFCDPIVWQNDILIVADTLLDERFVDDPSVNGSPHVRFFAGYPLITQDGSLRGSLAVMGDQPGNLDEQQQEMLKSLARQIINLLKFDASLSMLKEQFIEAKNSETKLRSFFESSSSCHLLIDKNLEVLAFNNVLSVFTERVFNLTMAVGMPAAAFTHASYLADFTAHCQEALAGENVQIEQHIQYEKEDIWWYITYNPALNTDGEIIGVSYNATDITKRVAQEHKVYAQNEALRKIAFVQSHELRRPVASILGLMNMIEMEGFEPGKEEMMMLKMAVEELDEKIHLIVGYTSN